MFELVKKKRVCKSLEAGMTLGIWAGGQLSSPSGELRAWRPEHQAGQFVDSELNESFWCLSSRIPVGIFCMFGPKDVKASCPIVKVTKWL